MKYKLISFLLVVNFYSNGNTCFPAVNFNKIIFQQQLDEFIKEPSLPEVVPLEDEIPSEDVSFLAPQHLKDDFEIIVKYAFGRNDTIKLKACGDCGDFISVYQDKAIYYSPKELDILKQDFPRSWRAITRFILAHEIAHMIHEKMTLVNPNGKSPQGNTSLIRYTPEMDFKKLVRQFGSEAIYHKLVRGSKSQLEVDGIALLLLKNLGIDAREEALEWRLKNAKESKYFFRIDSYLRVLSLKYNFYDAKRPECSNMNEEQEVYFWANLPEGIEPDFLMSE